LLRVGTTHVIVDDGAGSCGSWFEAEAQMVRMAGYFGATVSIDVNREIMVVKISYDSLEIMNNINRFRKVM
jgi:hypothetical protein